MAADAGVYVGASSLDYGSRQMADPASIEAHFVTGNALSILANRISYIYGLNGPSLTVDTACSSSLVALNQAMLALESGTIDTAIVAGVNIIMSPASFVGFSRAGMLSPTGLCRPFSAKADGYVRAEGGAVLVLRAERVWRGNGERPRAMIVASAVNSDGRTTGFMLPSAATQRSLLDDLYRQRGIDPTSSPSSRRMAPAPGSAIRWRPRRSAARSASRAASRCRSARSNPTSAISSRPPGLPACSRRC